MELIEPSFHLEDFELGATYRTSARLVLVLTVIALGLVAIVEVAAA